MSNNRPSRHSVYGDCDLISPVSGGGHVIRYVTCQLVQHNRSNQEKASYNKAFEGELEGYIPTP